MAKEEKPLEYERRIVDTKGLAQRIDLNYLRRAHPLRALRRRLMWVAPLLTAVALLPLFFFGGGRKAFSSGPVSAPHAIFENRCTLCHAAAFNAVADNSCRTCHDAGPHHAGIAEGRCADCHREHQSSVSLAQVDDLRCLRCHADLRHAVQRTPVVAARITGFAASAHPEFRAIAAADQRPLRLNHKKHMMLSREDARRFRMDAAALPMKCGDCHSARRDSTTGDMSAISFDRNCRACHARELEFDVTQLLPAGAGTAPHMKDAVAIRAAIEREYRALVARDPSVVRRTLGRDFVARNEAEWVGTATRLASNFLFSRKCRYCHQSGGDAPAAEVPAAALASGAIPADRDELPLIRKVNNVEGRYVAEKPNGEPWFLRSRKFSHRVHRPVACTSCHDKSPGSASTADVLIPSARSCMPCHGKTGTTQDNCSQCHLYHDRSKEVDRDRRPIEELIAHAGRKAAN